MSSIRPIDATSVHRIHSGQVVLDLQGCLKELVENALDAGSTSVEVRIKDSGLSTIEVQDNGSGIPATDWEFIGLKHHTSKLPSYDFLPNVETFGFRGEALSALCALCETVTIVTCTKETEPMGSVLMLGRDGRVLDTSGKVARSRGTTITLSGLFSPLPVRRKEFERNHKKELSKALTLLTAYALFPTSSSRSIKFKVDTINTIGSKTKRNTLLANDGRGDLRSSVISIWGSKALDYVKDFELDLKVDMSGYEKLKSMRKKQTQSSQIQSDLQDDVGEEDDGEGGGSYIKVKGLISSVEWGKGRTSADRQYFYINGRPAELKNVAKVINEVYKSFNSQQIPMALLDFEFPKQSVDINVSPDKRTILIHSESNFLAALRTSLEKFYAPSRNVYMVEGGNTQSNRTIKATQSKLDLATKSASKEGVTEEDDLESLEEEEAADMPRKKYLNLDIELMSGDEADGGAAQGPEYSGEAADVTEIENSHGEEANELEEEESRIMIDPQSRVAPIVASPIGSRLSTQRSSKTSSTRNTSSSSQIEKNGQNGVTGLNAKKRLRERLAMYSQTPSSQDVVQLDQDDDGDALEAQDSAGDAESSNGAEEDDMIDHLSYGKENDIETSSSPIVQADNANPDNADDKEDIEMMDSLSSSKKITSDRIVHSTSPTSPINSAPGSPDPELQNIIDSAQLNHSLNPENENDHYRSEITSTNPSGEITLSFNLPRLYKRYRSRSNHTIKLSPGYEKGKDVFEKVKDGNLTYEASILNKNSEAAEEALSRVIEKKDFEKMKVLGQFNKGFIIARLIKHVEGSDLDFQAESESDRINQDGRKDENEYNGESSRNNVMGEIDEVSVGFDNKAEYEREVMREKRRERKIEMDDLYIIDQHASDEKYNFETLQKITIIKGQALIRPRPLQLTAADELTAMENIDILKANGFEVDINEDELPGKGERVKLVAMPVSKETVFDFKDLEQLLHLLSDSSHSSGQMVRCAKARSMFAMRACRKSIMIGKSLTKNQMTQVLKNMGTIDQPWNCPHGRPTMRHLVKIKSNKDVIGKERIDWKRWKLDKMVNR